MSLPKAEVRRFFKRRFIRLFLLLTFLGLAIFPIAFTATSQVAGPEQRAKAEAQAKRDYEFALADHQRRVSECETREASGASENQLEMEFGPNCGRDFAPLPEYFQADNYMPFEFEFRQEFPISVSVFSGIVAMVAFLIGATFVGAEWNSGGMMNLLLWRPKRIPVLLTKLGVLLGSVLAVTAVLGALWTAAFWAIGKWDGRMGNMTQGAWESVALSGARGATLILVAAALGFGLASFGRHTAMALGAALGVFVISEIGLRIALGLVGTQFGERYVLSTYAIAWFSKEYTLFDYNSCEFAMGQCNPAELTITWQQSAVVFAVALVAVLGAAIWSMRRRDIT